MVDPQQSANVFDKQKTVVATFDTSSQGSLTYFWILMLTAALGLKHVVMFL